ncbi:aspartyl aminopeptidase [Thiogranum longum]|uniref:M18 family aminopeptidase n=1 Tax=Thiogranum longum TaxID=1537524 RepID=A0A4R1HGM1_9GAMM|nr:M18 family aminopeptidase [Thiogranum longum]TCK19430.1 aspartyl aminopeptidase [Thiogranum longum]
MDSNLNSSLLDFIQRSPTPFHATDNLRSPLLDAGFEELHEAERWQTVTGGRYFVTRNGSSLVAFTLGEQPPSEHGFRMAGAHTDSPCLHIKPQPVTVQQGYYQLGVEVYGGALLNPWFDRDLSIAGRVSYQDSSKKLGHVLVDFKQAVASIPSLAIHLDRDANKSRSINAQKHLPPILMQTDEEGSPPGFRKLLRDTVRKQHPRLDIEEVLEFELSLYDCQPPAQIGLNGDFLAAARLDNLLSCYIGLRALLDSDNSRSKLLVCNDHEEVGSTSACGADGPFLKSVLQRLCSDSESMARCIDRSWMVSVDNAHGIHPNYADKHDGNHGPLLNHGPVIKTNASQRYATNSETAALFRLLCERAGVPVQSFVVRSDMACGSTIGPVTASNIGVRTLDAGVPTFAMHSIRELAGSQDTEYLYKALKEFFVY